MSTVCVTRITCLTLLLTGCAARGATTSAPTTEAPSIASAPETPAAPELTGENPVAPTEPAPASTEPEPAPIEAEPTPTEPDPATRGPLTDAQVEILFGSAEDQPAEYRGGVTKAQENKHYLAGNERTLQIYHPVLDGLGGGYIGVGTDQAYLFMSWARPQIAWLIDYDAAVVEVHELYRLFFAAAETPEQMVALWDRPAKEEALAIIANAHPGRRAKSLRRWYLGYRGWIHRRLAFVTRTMRAAKVPTYLTDQEHYDFVRQMLEQRRVRPMVLNLHDDKGLRGLAKAARDLGVPIRVLYLSNAEEYWPRYPKRYRKNIADLPYADDAIVVRTLLTWKLNHDYRYNVQPVANYLEWLEQPYIDDVYDITHARPKADPEIINFFETKGSPEDSPSARRWRKAQAKQGKG